MRTVPRGAEWLDETVIISKDAITFGSIKVPGLIAEHGITVTPGDNDVNTMTVTFIVGKVLVEDATTGSN